MEEKRRFFSSNQSSNMSYAAEKSALRETALRNLKANAPLRSEKSAVLWNTLTKRADVLEAQKNGQLMVYLDFGEEVQTTRFLRHHSFFPESGFIIPLCRNNELTPVRIFSLDETESGTFGILEPKKEIVCSPERIIPPEEICFVLVPGLAFDRHGNRLGRGKGYYDRFLSKLSPQTVTAGLAFECQIFESVPVAPGDQSVSLVITENS